MIVTETSRPEIRRYRRGFCLKLIINLESKYWKFFKLKYSQMSGTLVIKPVEAKLTHDTETFGKMDPYCQVLIGKEVIKGQVCHSGGKNPKWHNEIISVKRNYEPVCYIELKDKDTVTADDIIGVTQIDLTTLVPSNITAKWYPIFYKQKSAGEVLLEIVFTPNENPQNSSTEHHHHHHHAHYGTN